MNWKHELFALGYFALFGAVAAALLWQRKQRRKTRLPFGDDLKLLRAPGETQLGLVRKSEEDALLWLVWAAVVPATIGTFLLYVTSLLPGTLQLVGVAVTFVGLATAFFVVARWFAGKTTETGNRYLGYFGERVVAEQLEPLKAQGWRIFHDVPGTADERSFNIDHIAVGPQGVFVIETKTRRKGGARPGFDDHKVYFDGRSLVWPWGEDNHGLDQAERNATWLADTLKVEIGERVPVMPYLTLPGWWVENKPSRDSRLCRVVDAKALPRFLSDGAGKMEPRQVEAIAAKLEARCRDVEY